jgi:hypothetical protein
MSEAINQTPSPEQRVFGDAYSLVGGVADLEVQRRYFEERKLLIYHGHTTWLSRALDDEQRVCADLYKDRRVIATLDFNFDTNLATVFTTSEGGSVGDTFLCGEVQFQDAVTAADQFIEE